MHWTHNGQLLRSLRLALICAMLCCLRLSAHAQSANFNVSQPTMVPGTVLAPGSYSIRIVDHLQDRLLVHIEGAGKSSPITLIAVPSPSVTGSAGVVPWPSPAGTKPALRGFIFNHGSHLEFVYPKDQAVALAKANSAGVLAVDPASENKPAELASLDKEDMEAVTLWALTPQRVAASPGEVNISAAKYKAAPDNSSSGKTQMARAEPPAVPIKRLPHTASWLPLILLIGIVSFLCANIMALRRLSSQQR